MAAQLRAFATKSDNESDKVEPEKKKRGRKPKNQTEQKEGEKTDEAPKVSVKPDAAAELVK